MSSQGYKTKGKKGLFDDEFTIERLSEIEKNANFICDN